ncbi:MAG TPA: YfhO family protein [Bryobacteraceae bacterium]|nr:YfhO family protein [Bryobacteraceae bacterium]
MPIWDVYTFSGRSFPGEMQTAVFYPLHVILALIPSGRNYVLSPLVYQLWFVFTHFLGAVFMFALLRHFQMGRFASYFGGVCFSLGGFVSRMPWPHMLESSIWLPLIVLFFLRASDRPGSSRLVLNASTGGIMFGLSILAGGLHIAIMQVLILIALSIFLLTARDDHQECAVPGRRSRIVLATLIVGGVGVLAGAVQLLPSAEYSSRAVRFLGEAGAFPANESIPYDLLRDGLLPGAFVSLLIPTAFQGILGSGEVINPYAGVLPLIFAIAGTWATWERRWTKFLTLLAFVSFLYSLGGFSPLHGLLYTVIPRLWMAREAGRIVYLTNFALAILTAFGVQHLFSDSVRTVNWAGLQRVYTWVVVAAGGILLVGAVLGRPALSPWIHFSLLMMILSYALFSYIIRGSGGRSVQFLAVALTLFDLAAFDWSAANKRETARTGINHFERLFSCRRAVEFLRAQPGFFRVEVAADPTPNIGNFFGVETTYGAGVTIPTDYFAIMGRRELLNVRYRLTPASAKEPGTVWSDAVWQIQEVPNPSPRAWLVHQATVETSPDRCRTLLSDPQFDPRRIAIIDSPVSLDAAGPGGHEAAVFSRLAPASIQVHVHAASRALLVLSETYYPGWRATVNGIPQRIYRTDVALRGIVVPSGDSEVVLHYTPLSIYLGGALSAATFGCVLAAWVVASRHRFRLRWRRRPE